MPDVPSELCSFFLNYSAAELMQNRLPGWFGAVVKNVSKVASAAIAHRFRAAHAVADEIRANFPLIPLELSLRKLKVARVMK